MLYFKNNDLAEAHHVSLRTVLNWIEAAKNGKLDLLLHEHNGKHYVANTTRNIATIEAFVEERRKYRNTKSFKIVEPKPEFYKLYNEDQILDILANLDIYREIPFQYTYFDGGAADWDRYAKRLGQEIEPNLLNSTRKLLNINDSYLQGLIGSYERINVVDLGVGNAMPVRDFVDNLVTKNKMGKYIAIDISKDMLNLAEANIKKWFNNQVEVNCHEIDFAQNKFAKLLAQEYIKNPLKDTVNVVMVFGGTIANFRYPDSAFRNISSSMSKEDIFIYGLKLDTPNSRKYFDFNNTPDKAKLAATDRLVLDLLNINDAFYDVEMGYEEADHQRFIRIRFKVALTIKFSFMSGEHSIDFHKDDTVLLWRYWHQSAKNVTEQLSKNELPPLQTSQTNDREYILTISKLNVNN